MNIPELSLKFIDPLFENIVKIPKLQRIAIFVGSIILLIGAFVYFSFMPKFDTLQSLKGEKDKLKTELAVIEKKAKELKKYEGQIKDAEKNFILTKAKLPEQKDIPDLLYNISEAGHKAGLEFLLFQPELEKTVDFYSELPVSIKVVGNYHSTAMFFDNVSMLFRIVNLSNISIAPVSSKTENKLSTSCRAITYRFIEASQDKKQEKKKKKEQGNEAKQGNE